jgi:hypothetical protein
MSAKISYELKFLTASKIADLKTITYCICDRPYDTIIITADSTIEQNYSTIMANENTRIILETSLTDDITTAGK